MAIIDFLNELPGGKGKVVEFWRAGGSESRASADKARKVEAEGWDGQMFMDSQCLTCDPYVSMSVWAGATERLKLSTGVTNPLSRHPAVTAACAASVQAISGGRAVLGIGRGDSALAYLGYAPVRLPAFRRVLENLQTLLRGEAIDFGAQGGAGAIGDAPSLETMSLGGRPDASSLKWLPREMPKVPLDVAATGPKVIAMAAQIAERVTFSVGAIPERVRWAVELARAAAREQGVADDEVSYGVQIIVICHPNVDAMRELATRFVTPLARFQVIQGEAAGPRTASDAANFAAIRRGYDMNKHGDIHANDKLIGESLTWDFVERFAIIGSPERCTQRLLELAKLGIERFVIVGPGFYPEPDPNGPSLFAREVIPAVRQATASITRA